MNIYIITSNPVPFLLSCSSNNGSQKVYFICSLLKRFLFELNFNFLVYVL